MPERGDTGCPAATRRATRRATARCPRRTLLAGAGAAGLSALLAACGQDAPTGAGRRTAAPGAKGGLGGDGSDGSRAPGTSPTTRGTPTPPAPGTTPPGPGPTTAPPTDGQPPGRPGDPPLAAVNDIPIGGGLLSFEVSAILLVRPTASVVRGFDARCPHEATIVDEPDNGVVTCSGHGSRFRAKDGSFISGPAGRGLDPVPVRIRDGHVYLA